MPNYRDGKIYAIRSYQTDLIYVGSTCNTLSARLGNHKSDNKSGHGSTSHQILQYEDAYIELIEDFPCDNKEQLNKREGEVIRETNCVNKRIAGQTDVEYYKSNKEKILDKNKKYYESHKQEISEQKKGYYEEHKEKTLVDAKKYREEHAEEIKAKDKERHKIKSECPVCKKIMSKHNILKHVKKFHPE